MKDIHHILDVIQHTNKRSILATVIHVEGSAYRKEGTSALFQEDGIQIGMLSGGCLEHDLALRIRELFADPKAFSEGVTRTIIYDMRAEDDLSWGQGAGCNGVIHILLEAVNDQLREHLCTLKHLLDHRVPVTLIKKLPTDDAITDYLFISKERTFGHWRGEIPPLLQRFKTNEAPLFAANRGIKQLPDFSASFFIHHFFPKPRLIIFGAGPDVKPLAVFATQTGFSVTIVDWRPALCNRTQFPDADEILLGFPEEIIDKLMLTSGDSVIIMTHHFQRDKELLYLLMKHKLRYLGILGPRERTSRLLEGADIPPWIRSPVGLPIGAEGPEEIAISILAEMIHAYRHSSAEMRALHETDWHRWDLSRSGEKQSYGL